MNVRRIALGLVVAAALAGPGCGLLDSKGRQHERAQRVELNTATRKELADLPGLNKGDADRIIAARPYKTRRGLIGKQVLTASQFEAVKDLVYVEHEAGD